MKAALAAAAAVDAKRGSGGEIVRGDLGKGGDLADESADGKEADEKIEVHCGRVMACV